MRWGVCAAWEPWELVVDAEPAGGPSQRRRKSRGPPVPRRKKECSQQISMAVSQALLQRGQSSEVILTTFDEDIPVTRDVGLIHVRVGKLRGEHLRSPWAVWTGSQSECEDLPFGDGGDHEVHSVGFLTAFIGTPW